VSLAALLAGGCGLGDYEDLMLAEQKRLADLDKQEKALGEPAEIPVRNRPGSDPTPDNSADVFLRLPRGIASKPDQSTSDFLHRFPRSNAAPSRSRSGENKESPFWEVYVAVEAGGKAEAFQTKVLQPFPPAREKFVKAAEDSTVHGRMEFMATKLEDSNTPPWAYWVFFAPVQGVHVAVIYRVPKDKAESPEVKSGIDLSLQSLVVGPEAAKWRQRFAAANEPKKKGR
jgi:hypothetical protein